MTRLKTRRKQAMVGRRDDERRGLIWFAQTQVKAKTRRKQADAMMRDVGGGTAD